MTRILIAEDDPLVSSFIEKGLQNSGFVTVHADNGALAVQLAQSEEFDLLVLDMGLPDGDGLEVLRTLRGAGQTLPIIVLTGMAERDVVTCLEAGADDYMRKPFHFAELLARLRARLQHAGPAGSSSVEITVGGLRLDLRTRRAHVDGGSVDLTSREFALLETFMRHPDQVLSREQLLSQVWGYTFDPSTNLVNVYINTLRKKLGQDLIETVRGAGYRLRAR